MEWEWKTLSNLVYKTKTVSDCIWEGNNLTVKGLGIDLNIQTIQAWVIKWVVDVCNTSIPTCMKMHALKLNGKEYPRILMLISTT